MLGTLDGLRNADRVPPEQTHASTDKAVKVTAIRRKP
jgi:hypothetical protein